MKTNFAGRLGLRTILSVWVLAAGPAWLNAGGLSPQVLKDGKVRLSLVGEIGANYALDRSFSLTSGNWAPQVTNIAGAGGVLLFTNTPDLTTNNFWRVRSLPYDTNAAAYAAAVGLTDSDAIGRVNGFVLALKSYGLWTGMDGLLLRTNFNNGVLRSLAGNYATNSGGVTLNGAGAHYDGVNGCTVLPTPISSTNTMLFLFAGDPTPNPSQTPFGLFNLAGTNAGAIYPFANSVPYYEQRWAISGNGSGESSSGSEGWFRGHGGPYLYPADFRLRVWSMGWDNAGAQTSYIDGQANLTTSAYATRLTNGSLNAMVLGARLTASGGPVNFAKVHVQAAFVWPFVLNSNQVFLAQKALQWLMPGDERILWIGDSMTAFNGPAALSTGMTATNYWPAILYGWEYFGADLGDPQHSEFTPHDMAVSGVIASFFSGDRMASYYGAYAAGGPVARVRCYIMIGINNIGLAQDGLGAFREVSNLWWMARNTLGAKVTAFTLPGVGSCLTNDFSVVGGVTNYALPLAFYTNSVARSNLNALVRSARDQWDDLVDLDLAFPSSAMETNAVPRLSYEGLHMLGSGQTNLVYQVIHSAGGSP
jgi:hypothetical protein